MEWLPFATFSYNDKIHSATGYSPFFLNHGRHPWKGTELNTRVQNQSAQDLVSAMASARESAKKALEKANDRMKAAYDKHKAPSVEYQKGDKVMLEMTNIPTQRPSRKLEDHRQGPFEILEKIGRSAYRIKLPDSWLQKGVSPVFNEAYLKPFVEPKFSGQLRPKPPGPVSMKDTHVYEVDEVLDSRLV